MEGRGEDNLPGGWKPQIRGHEWKEESRIIFPQAGNSRLDPNLLLTDWARWWRRMEGEAECSRRWERKERQAEKESFFRNRVQPNIILTGWTTWW